MFPVSGASVPVASAFPLRKDRKFRHAAGPA